MVSDIDVNNIYLPLLKNQDRYIFLWGGRNSGKSVFAAQKSILRCLEEKYFRCILIKKTYESIKDSQYQTLKDLIYEYKLEDYFIFRKSPLEIECKLNGNLFIARGLDKPEKIKSIKDPSCIWYEEGNQITEEDFITTTTSIRSDKADYLQEIFSFNPETEINYEDFWLYKMFFSEHSEKSFSDNISIILPNNEEVTYQYTVLHTTYIDNKFVTPQQIADLEQWKEINSYYYTIFTLGEWGNKDVSDKYWKNFSRINHVKKCDMNIDLPLHISFDENINPYPALTIWQEEDRNIRQIHEICLRSPRNKLTEVAKEFRLWAKSYDFENIVFIYGDATSAKEDAKLEKGYNYFTLLKRELEVYFIIKIKKPSKNPPIVLRGEYINTIYSSNYDGWSISIDPLCKESINDYTLVQENTDGTMKKPKKNGVEILGHCSDSKAYFICELTKNSFNKFKSGIKKENSYSFYGTKNKYY